MLLVRLGSKEKKYCADTLLTTCETLFGVYFPFITINPVKDFQTIPPANNRWMFLPLQKYRRDGPRNLCHTDVLLFCTGRRYQNNVHAFVIPKEVVFIGIINRFMLKYKLRYVSDLKPRLYEISCRR